MATREQRLAAPDADGVTVLLRRWGDNGDRDALDELIPLVHEELRRIAGRLFAAERSGHTLQPTALVSEAYARLLGRRQGRWTDRLHFFCFAAREMRRVLVDHARKSRALKRGHGIEIVSFDGEDLAVEPKILDLLSLDEALRKLAQLDKRHARIVELHYFAGLDIDEIAIAEGVSRPTVYRGLSMARAWLKREISALGKDALDG